MLIGLEGYAIGYDMFEGGIYEGHTLIPFIERIKEKFDIDKPIIVADSGLLNQKNINYLKELGYQFILGGRVKNESINIKDQILQINREDGHVTELKGSKGDRLKCHIHWHELKKKSVIGKKGL